MARHHALHGGGGGHHHHHGGGGGGWRGGYGPSYGWPQVYAEPDVIVVPAPIVTMAAPSVVVPVTPSSVAAASAFFKTPLGMGAIGLAIYLLLKDAA